MFVSFVLVLVSFSHAYTFKFNLTNATINTAWNPHAPDVLVAIFVGDEDYIWTSHNTYTPTWGTAYTWTNVTDNQLGDVEVYFVDERIEELIGDGAFDLSSSSYKSSEDNPVVHRFNFTGIDNVDYFIGAVTITGSGGSNASCTTFNTKSTCESNANCIWYDSVCIDENWLCDGWTCDTCFTADQCANDPDINDAGGCVWNATSRECQEPTTGNECSSYNVSTCDFQSSCSWYKNICYPKNWLCSKYSCDSCSSSVSCANDPDMSAAGGCTWDSSKNVCYNASAVACEKVCAEANAGCKPSCVVNIEGCSCMCDTTGCVLETVVGEGKKWDDHSMALESITALPHSSRNSFEKIFKKKD